MSKKQLINEKVTTELSKVWYIEEKKSNEYKNQKMKNEKKKRKSNEK